MLQYTSQNTKSNPWLLLLVVLFVLLLADRVMTSPLHNCSWSRISGCINQTEMTQQWSDAQSSSFYMDEHQLNSTCSSFQLKRSCLVELLSSSDCINVDQSFIRTFYDLFHYWCVTAYTEYKSFHKCYGSPVLNAELRLCKEKLLIKWASMNDTDPDTACRLKNDALRCYWRSTVSHCGTTAATWQHQATVIAAEQMLQSLKCEIDDPSTYAQAPHSTVEQLPAFIAYHTPTSVVVLIVISCVLIVLLLVHIVILAIKLKNYDIVRTGVLRPATRHDSCKVLFERHASEYDCYHGDVSAAATTASE